MRFDLEELRIAHPQLPQALAASMSLHVALALQRRDHASPCAITMHTGSDRHRASLHWRMRDPAAAQQIEPKRITEVGAEAVALALVSLALDWEVDRRAFDGSGADWVVTERSTGRVIYLEVGGTDVGSVEEVLSKKIRQVEGGVGEMGFDVAACAVRFREPIARLVEHVGRRDA